MATAAEPRPAELPLKGGRESANVKLTPILTATDHGADRSGSFATRAGWRGARRFGIGVPKDQWVKAPIQCFLVEHPSAGTILIDTGFHASVAVKPRSNLGLFGPTLYRDIDMRPEQSAAAQLRERGIEPLERRDGDHDPPPSRPRERDRGLPGGDLPRVERGVGGGVGRRPARRVREAPVRPRLRLPADRLRLERRQLVLRLRALVRRVRRRERARRLHAGPHDRAHVGGAAHREGRGAGGGRRDLHAPHSRRRPPAPPGRGRAPLPPLDARDPAVQARRRRTRSSSRATTGRPGRSSTRATKQAATALDPLLRRARSVKQSLRPRSRR